MGGAGRPGRVRSILEDRIRRISFDARAWRKAPGGRALFSGCDAGLSAEAILANAGLRVSEKIVLDAEHGVDMNVWRAVRETDIAGGENR